jgi:hypothetical protein
MLQAITDYQFACQRSCHVFSLKRNFQHFVRHVTTASRSADPTRGQGGARSRLWLLNNCWSFANESPGPSPCTSSEPLNNPGAFLNRFGILVSRCGLSCSRCICVCVLHGKLSWTFPNHCIHIIAAARGTALVQNGAFGCQVRESAAVACT